MACSYRRSFPPRRYVGPNGIGDFLSYRLGLPREANLVLDVRFLTSPHYIDGLRALRGSDPAVSAHVATDPECKPFLESIDQMLQTLIPFFKKEGKAI